ncbi:hypothetical protein [Parafilimonas sp.]|uniref:hypothetical protein n=1 Tax=Parafilimonas sp. TaxID=1969739 RepID=UPI0039E61568
MKRHISPHSNLLIIILAVAPFMAHAQFDEYYGRPSYWRPYDQRGINVFETTKTPDSIPYTGPRVRLGAGFTQQFQNLEAENTALNNGGNTVATAEANKLYPLSPGFMTAMANLYVDIQLADGIRLNVTSYLSARHHNETWVKGGYIQFDKLPFKGEFWTNLMKITTIKVGHMEINYGDAHFRRSDGGQALYNPFMESYIMDAFATEIGGEVYVQKNGLFGMVGVSNGMIKGNVDSAQASTVDANTHTDPSVYLKAGIDRQLTEKVRVRVSGSYYHNSSSPRSGLTLYGGDRTGSNYQNVVEKWVSDGAAQSSDDIAFSGRLNPGFTKKIDAFMLNGFLKAGGFEFFGTYENAKGRTKTETENRTASQYGVEGVYRFGSAENVYVGIRYNEVKAELSGFTDEVNVNRVAFAAGWFVTKNLLLKGEVVNQHYKNFPDTDYRNGAKFNGYVIEAVVGF